MKINQGTKIIGENIILIPYEKQHVEKYHQWMMNAELQELTASEPLTLEQEYEMQKSWRLDEDKCTFLILSKELFLCTNNEIESLIGDTNLFLCKDEDDKSLKVGEAEIMIAEKSHRGKKFGWEGMLLMLKYGQEYLKIDKFIAKIGADNLKSINLFKKMKFSERSRSAVFRELTLDRTVNYEWMKWLDEQINFEIVKT